MYSYFIRYSITYWDTNYCEWRTVNYSVVKDINYKLTEETYPIFVNAFKDKIDALYVDIEFVSLLGVNN